MNTKINDGGSAFPRVEPHKNGFGYGMSLRDYFAAQMLQGLGGELTRIAEADGVSAHELEECADGMAKLAYVFADAMVRARGQ